MEPSTKKKNTHSQRSKKNHGPKNLPLQQGISVPSPLRIIFESLLNMDNPFLINQALLNLNNFVLFNQIPYKALETELMNIFTIYYNSFVKTGRSPLLNFIRRFLELYKGARSLSLNPYICDLFIKTSQKVKKSLGKVVDYSLKELALTFWTCVDGLNMEDFLATFEITELIEPTEILSKIDLSISNEKKLIETANYISVLELHDYVPIPLIMSIITRLVQSKQFELLKCLVRKFPEYQTIAVHVCIKANIIKKALDFIKDFQLNPDDFPLTEGFLKDHVRKYVSSEKWTKVEENLSVSKKMLGYYIEELIQENNIDLAVSIAVRHGLGSPEFINEDILAKIQPYLENNSSRIAYTNIANNIYTNDDYEPTEELLGEKLGGTFWNLQDFGIDINKHVVFIDDCGSDVFNQSVKEILSTNEVILDGEFIFGVTRYHQTKLALVQIATSQKVYLLDYAKMSSSPQYQSFMKNLLSNPSILKVGLSLDFKWLEQGPDGTERITTQNTLDLTKVYTSHFKDTKSSLPHICETLLKKPLSNYEQTSNWERRPLRKAQVHYAALKAYATLRIHMILKVVMFNPVLLDSIRQEQKRELDTSEASLNALCEHERDQKANLVETVVQPGTSFSGDNFDGDVSDELSIEETETF